MSAVLPFSLGLSYAVLDQTTLDLRAVFGGPEAAFRYALDDEIVVKCRLMPLEVVPNPHLKKATDAI